MTENQIMRKIKLPPAVPVIFAGIRTSAVLNVGTAYLAFFIGGGGLVSGSSPVSHSLTRPNCTAGAIPGALLAIGLDSLFAFVEGRLSGESMTEQSPVSG